VYEPANVTLFVVEKDGFTAKGSVNHEMNYSSATATCWHTLNVGQTLSAYPDDDFRNKVIGTVVVCVLMVMFAIATWLCLFKIEEWKDRVRIRDGVVVEEKMEA